MFAKCLAILICLMPIWHAEVPSSDYEFLYVSHKYGVSRYQSSNQTSVDMVSIPSHTAIEFDNKHNCLYYASTHSIRSRCFTNNSQTYETVLAHYSDLNSMTYDWISDNLYFIDSFHSEIGLLHLMHNVNRSIFYVRRTVLEMHSAYEPTAIAVNPIKGYLFWANSRFLRSIMRANLDGTNMRVLVVKPFVNQPVALAIDYENDYVYWTDYGRSVVMRCDFNGGGIKDVIRNIVEPGGLVIHKTRIIWTSHSNSMGEVYAADKVSGENKVKLLEYVNSPKYLAIATENMPAGTNACADEHKCREICVGKPGGSYNCLCPDGMNITSSGECLCPGNSLPSANERNCLVNKTLCGPTYFTCRSTGCVLEHFLCDGHDDCTDGSDEVNCKDICRPDQIRCKSDGRCLSKSYRCDDRRDCADGSDEWNCTSKYCEDYEFRCNDHRCIPQDLVCDEEPDCPNGADEMNCDNIRPKIEYQCTAGEFSCGDNTCIHISWVCDDAKDCESGIDESNCGPSTTTEIVPSSNTSFVSASVAIKADVVKIEIKEIEGILLEWKPKDNRTDVVYAVHIGRTKEEFLSGPTLKTTALVVPLEDLSPCEKYMAGVTLHNQTANSISEDNLVRFTTKYDVKEPAKHIHFALNEKLRSMSVTWEHSCTLHGNHPSEYILNITDVLLKNTTTIRVPSSNDTVQVYRVAGRIPRGARYNVSISFAGQTSDTIAVYQVHAFHLPSPAQLLVQHVHDDRFLISWPRVLYNETDFAYEVLVARGLTLNDDVHYAMHILTKQTNITIVDLAATISTTTNFTVGVRIKTSLGYTSIINNYEHIEVAFRGDGNVDNESLIARFETEIIIIGTVSLFLGLTFLVAVCIWYCNIKKSPVVDETPMRPMRSRNNVYHPTVGENVFSLGNIEENDEEERLIEGALTH